MDDLARDRREVVGIADHPVVEAGTDGEQHVTVLHRQVGLDRTVHARHAEELRVGRRIRAKPHQGIGDRKAEATGQAGQLLGAIRQNDPASGIDHRSPGFEQQVYGLPDLAQMTLDHRVVRAHLDGFRVFELALGGGDVLRDVDDDRARATAVGDVEGLLQRQRELVYVVDQEVVLDAGPRDADGIALLEGVLADVVVRHLSRDDDDRDRIHVGGSDPGHGIGRARARRDERDADPVRRACQAVGGVNGCLLVADENVLHLILLEERIINVQHGATGIAENVLDLFFLQAPDYNLSTGHHRHCRRPSKQVALKKVSNVKALASIGQGVHDDKQPR